MKNKLIAACFAVFSAFYSCDDACGCERPTGSDKKRFAFDGTIEHDAKTSHLMGLFHAVAVPDGPGDAALEFILDLSLPTKELSGQEPAKESTELYTFNIHPDKKNEAAHIQMITKLDALKEYCDIDEDDLQNAVRDNSVPSASIKFNTEDIYSPTITGLSTNIQYWRGAKGERFEDIKKGFALHMHAFNRSIIHLYDLGDLPKGEVKWYKLDELDNQTQPTPNRHRYHKRYHKH